MKKIPTIFERDWNGDRSRVLDKSHPDCAWVFAGEGVATRKLDGTSCAIIEGRLFKRREVKLEVPEGDDHDAVCRLPSSTFLVCEVDKVAGKIIGWMPVGVGPEDQWHREAYQTAMAGDGTYELLGPKVQGGREKDLWGPLNAHILVAHNDRDLLTIREPFERTYCGLQAFLQGRDIEGIVFQHQDGRMAKIKGKDFGLKRP